MADKNFQMTQRNSANTAWDNLFPLTKGGNVTASNGQTVDTHVVDTSHVRYAPDTGTANAKVVTLNPAATAYVDGLPVAFKNAILNTGAVTINVNGLGVKPVLKSNGGALVSGSLKAGSIYTIRYNSTTGNFILQGEGGEYGTAAVAQVLTGYTLGTDSGVIAGSMPNNGAQNKSPSTVAQTIPQDILQAAQFRL